MSARDFMPFRTLGGGSEERLAGSIDGSETFLAGEPLVMDSTVGRLTEASSDPPTIFGISAEGALDADGNSRAVWNTITFYGIGRDQVYKTKNFATDGSGTQATTISTAIIGDYGGLIKASGDWFFDTGAENKICEVLSIEDAQGRNVGDINTLTEGGAVWIFFRFIL